MINKQQKITGNIQPPSKDLEILKQNFPNCFDKKGEFDFDKFKTQLSKNEISFSKESYGMDWLGKSYARLLATDETTTLLKEDEAFNQKPENAKSENLLIKGDNLEVLKHLSNAYYEKVKMIYIDPPYNTGSDGFVYADDRKFTIDELQELAGISEERAKRILDFTQSKSNSHSAWLTFMYPRLYIAKQLLKDDGVIFVSIDDNEVAQLRMVMDEIFGEENFVGEIIWLKRNAQNDADNIEKNHEYILVYTKIKTSISKNNTISKEVFKDKKNKYYYIGAGITTGGAGGLLNARPNLGYTIYFNEKTGDKIGIEDYDKNKAKISNNEVEIYTDRIDLINRGYSIIRPPKKGVGLGRWTWALDKFNREKDKILIKKTKNNFSVLKKEYIDDKNIYLENNKYLFDINKNKPFKSFIDDISSSLGIKELNKLFDRKIFENPKSTFLLKNFIRDIVAENDIILDFFAGSGTTGDAVMQLNADPSISSGCDNRKFILVQLPEQIDPKSNKTAYDFVKNDLKVETPTIFEITKERLIRAAKKIQEENLALSEAERKDLSNQDLGFKVFETTPIWEDYDFEAEKLSPQTTLFDESKLTEEDIKALLVTWKTYDGIPLTIATQATDLDGYTAHYSNERLYLMDKGFTTKNLKALLEKIDGDKSFNPTTIIAFGYHFESKNLREISENIKSYANKKHSDIDFITRY